MLRLASILFLVFLSGCALFTRTGTETSPLEVSGVLNGRTVLSGYIVVTGDVRVPPGSHLEIRPGSTVVIRNSESTKIDPEYLSSMTEILVQGTIVVDGEPESPVSFVPERMLAEGEAAWAGIILDRATDSTIRNATVMQAETGVLVVNSSPLIINSRFTKSRYGIVVQGGAAKILNNEVSVGESGIFCWNQSQPYLKGNIIVGNEEEGVVVDRSSMPYLDRNIVSGNDIGLVVPAKVPFDETMITGNRENVRVLPLKKELSR